MPRTRTVNIQAKLSYLIQKEFSKSTDNCTNKHIAQYILDIPIKTESTHVPYQIQMKYKSINLYVHF